MEDAEGDITDMFGAGAKERGEVDVDDGICSALYNLAEMVYDEQIRKASITITRGLKATISKTDNIPFASKAEQFGGVSYEGGESGQLNPTWVEWLMGCPVGWTDLGDPETPWCHSSFIQSLPLLPK